MAQVNETSSAVLAGRQLTVLVVGGNLQDVPGFVGHLCSAACPLHK